MRCRDSTQRPLTLWACCHVYVKVKKRVEALNRSEPGALLQDPSLRHMETIFTKQWGAEWEHRSQDMEKKREFWGVRG